jgi:hypothetical protein
LLLIRADPRKLCPGGPRIRGKVFAFPIPAITNFGNIGDFCGPQPAFFSQKPHPAIAVLLQTKGEVSFDSLMTALSKPIFSQVRVCFGHLLIANC